MTSTETLTKAERDLQFAQERLADYMEWRQDAIFMSVAEMRLRLNNAVDHLTAPADMTFICMLSRPEDLLEVANRMHDVTALVNAKLLKQVFTKEDTGPEEMAYLEEEGLIDNETEIYVAAEDFDYKEREFFVVTDVNRYYDAHEQVHVGQETALRGDYTLVPGALTWRALEQTYPCMLLVSDHSSFDRAGDMEIRHTMLFDLPSNVCVANTGFLEIIPQ